MLIPEGFGRTISGGSFRDLLIQRTTGRRIEYLRLSPLQISLFASLGARLLRNAVARRRKNGLSESENRVTDDSFGFSSRPRIPWRGDSRSTAIVNRRVSG